MYEPIEIPRLASLLGISNVTNPSGDRESAGESIIELGYGTAVRDVITFAVFPLLIIIITIIEEFFRNPIR